MMRRGSPATVRGEISPVTVACPKELPLGEKGEPNGTAPFWAPHSTVREDLGVVVQFAQNTIFHTASSPVQKALLPTLNHVGKIEPSTA